MFKNPSADQQIGDITSATNAYYNYKKEYVKHLSFAPSAENSSKFILLILLQNLTCKSRRILLAITLEHAPLEAVYLYFETASYDQIERDEKVMMEVFLV